MKTERTPWAALLATASGFGLAPATFWRMSLKEWRALAASPPMQSLPRSAFEALAERFPDNTND